MSEGLIITLLILCLVQVKALPNEIGNSGESILAEKSPIPTKQRSIIPSTVLVPPQNNNPPRSINPAINLSKQLLLPQSTPSERANKKVEKEVPRSGFKLLLKIFYDDSVRRYFDCCSPEVIDRSIKEVIIKTREIMHHESLKTRFHLKYYRKIEHHPGTFTTKPNDYARFGNFIPAYIQHMKNKGKRIKANAYILFTYDQNFNGSHLYHPKKMDICEKDKRNASLIVVLDELTQCSRLLQLAYQLGHLFGMPDDFSLVENQIDFNHKYCYGNNFFMNYPKNVKGDWRQQVWSQCSVKALKKHYNKWMKKGKYCLKRLK